MSAQKRKVSKHAGDEKGHLDRYVIPSVARALRVLEHLAESNDGPFSLTQLQRTTNIPLGTLFKIMSTLERLEYVERAPDGRYTTGRTLTYIGLQQLRRFDLRKCVRPVMVELARETGETAECGILSFRHWQLLIVEKVDSPNPIGLRSEPGALLELHTVAGGKVLLAHQPRETIDRFIAEYGLPKRTERTITDPETLRAALREIRAQGYAVDYMDARTEVGRVAAPIRDALGAVVAAIGIAGPTYRLDEERLEALAPAVVAAAERVSLALSEKPE